MVASTKGLHCLPVELLYEIQLYATSENFPLVSKWFHRLYSNTTASFRADYLLERLRSAHGSDLLSKALRYPLCTEPVLEALCLRLRLKGDKRSALSSAPQLPRRLFRGLQPRTLPNDNWRDRDPPLPFLRYLYSTKSFPPPDPNSHEGYALTKAVHTRFHTLAQLLLDNGASPKLKKGLAVFVAIRMNDIKMVKMLVERDGRKAVIVDDAHVDAGAPIAQQANFSGERAIGDGNGNSVGERGGHKVTKLAPGKKRRLEDRIEVTPEMLKVAVRCQAKEVVDYLTKEKGCVPDMQTLLMMTQ
ncbi:hypothetical protein ONZ45_g2141 [Pleurotus djamor]|nr:hypothetical protein ONZ45_g2141 [Pleurotus djamor]